MELKMIDLFADVDASQVPIGEASGVSIQRIQNLTLSKLPAKKKKHVMPKALLAAAIAATLAVSALAYAGFMKYKDPERMLEDAYGDSQQSSLVDATGPFGPVPDSHRVPVSQEALDLASPYIASVERTIKEGNLSLTVHGHLYDSVTGSGIVYYTLESPESIDYKAQFDGMLSQLPAGLQHCHSYSFLLKEKSTDKKLEIMDYYIRSTQDTENYIEVGFWGSGEYLSMEEEFERAQNTVKLPLNDGGGMEGLMGEGIRISPIGMHLNSSKMGFLKTEESKNGSVNGITHLSVQFKDGSEYVIEEENLQNYVFAAVTNENTQMVLPFNRLIDVKDVASVTVNDRKITELAPILEAERWRPHEYVERKPELDTAADAAGKQISFQGYTLIPGNMEYDTKTRTGWFTCRLESEENVKALLNNGYFDNTAAGLQLNQLGRWTILNQEKKSLELKFCFVGLEQESEYLKFWFAGSDADPRLNQSTENLICLPFENIDHHAVKLADGKILVSDLGMFIDYRALDIAQGSIPKNLSITFKDGSVRVISDWDEDIRDGFMLNSRDYGDYKPSTLRVSFSEPIDAAAVKSVTYAGKVFEK